MRFRRDPKALSLLSIAILVALAALLAGCGDDDGGQPAARGTLRLIAGYTGSLGPVDAGHPLVARLFGGADPYALGVPAATATLASSPDTVEVELAAGGYTLMVHYDRDGGLGLLERPYEIYEDHALGETPDLIAIESAGLTEIAVSFDDTRLQSPGALLPAFALPDSNPASATYAELWSETELAGSRALLYFAGPEGERAPDFTLADVNPVSETEGQSITFSTLRGRRVLMYFGGAGCVTCRDAFAAVTEIVAELQAEGLAVTGLMINDAIEAGYADLLEEVGSPLPALQDTAVRIGGSWKAALRYLYQCESGEPLLVFDADGREFIRQADTGGSEQDFDLSDAEEQEIVKAWLREAGTTSLCGEGGAQFAALTALASEAAAAGVQPLALLAVTRARGDCLRAALQSSGSLLPVLADTPAGLREAAGAELGDLLLLDGDGRIRLRLAAGPGAQDDLDLTLAADRQQVIAWLQQID